LSNDLWTFGAPPGGGQVATLETDVMKSWAVRVSLADRKIYLSDDQHACTPDILRSQHLHRMDTTGFYQRAGSFASVGDFLAPTVPTVKVSFLGETFEAQLDTGYQGTERQLQINQALFARLRDKLGRSTTRVVGDAGMDSYQTQGKFHLVDSDANPPSEMGLPEDAVVLVKTGSQSIAAWKIPAAQMSARLFFDIVDEVEFRADQQAMWVRLRAQPTGASACP
jgi:hypothetical protein